MAFTDSHAHLSLVSQESGRDVLASVLGLYARAHAAAMQEGRSPPILIDIGVDPDDLRLRLELLGQHGGLPPYIRLAAGLRPSAANLASTESSIAALEAAIVEAERGGARVAAIGEGGLDYHHMEGSAETQELLFEAQLALAARLALPLIVHSRDAATETLALVARRRGGFPVIIHCFGYGPTEARSFLDAGCWLSFAGNLTYKGSDLLRQACALVPEDRLLLETDSPYMNPMPRRRKSATPLDIERTYALAASLRGASVPDLAETVSRNASFLFG